MLAGRRLLIATKHKKELVIRPLLESALGVQCFIPEDFNTDEFGTFTREIERKNDALTTVREKCKSALVKYGCDLGVASEGSFGPHPSIPLIPCDDELIILIDLTNDFECVARVISTDTNFDGQEVFAWTSLVSFATRIGFPSHAVILKNDKLGSKQITKGINDWWSLYHHFCNLIETYGQAYVETDMRANHNPRRMEVIRSLTQKLITSLNSKCPSCGCPGFDVFGTIPGLPCRICRSATSLVKQYHYQCSKCRFEEKRSTGESFAEPQYCLICNP